LAARLFIHDQRNSVLFVTPITRIIRRTCRSTTRLWIRAATLEDVRAEVLTDRLKTVVSGFCGPSLFAMPGRRRGVLALLVSAARRASSASGWRLDRKPRHLLTGVVAEGAVMAARVVAGALFRIRAGAFGGQVFPDMQSRVPGRRWSPRRFCFAGAAVVASRPTGARAARESTSSRRCGRSDRGSCVEPTVSNRCGRKGFKRQRDSSRESAKVSFPVGFAIGARIVRPSLTYREMNCLVLFICRTSA